MKPLEKENARLRGTALALAREHKLHCPAINGIREHGRPEWCDISLYDLAILLRRAGIELTPDEQHELS